MQGFRTRSDKALKWAFIASLSIILLLILVPVFHAIQLSLFQSESFISNKNWVGLANYIRILNDVVFWRSLWVGLVFGLLTIGLQVFLGIIFALFLDRSFPGLPIIRGIVILPYLLPTVVVALAFQWMLDGTLGLLTIWAEQLGFGRPSWFENSYLAMTVVIISSVWTWTPFVTVSFLAALQTIPKSLYESAKVDGAGLWSQFWHVTIPMILPMLMVIILLRSIWMFNKFDIVWLLTKGGPSSATEHLPILAYRRAFLQYDVGGGAAVVTLSFLILSVLILIYFYYFPLEDKESSN